MLVTNEVVAPLYLERVVSALPEYDLSIATLPDGERQKNSEQ
jgi:3-dehydroquinate synthase